MHGVHGVAAVSLKTYTASTLQRALIAVRDDLGPAAVVLRTRTVKRGGILGLGAKERVEVTARPGRPAGGPRPRPAQPPASQPTGAVGDDGQRPKRRHLATAGEPALPLPLPGTAPPRASEDEPAGDLIRRTYAAAIAGQPDAQAPGRAPGAALATTQGAANSDLAAELAEVKRLVERMARERAVPPAPAPAPPGSADPLREAYAQRIRSELGAELAQLATPPPPPEPSEASDPAALLARLPEASEPPVGRPGAPVIHALVGPTGVGKTTTLAKLAARLHLQEQRAVGLITLDTYRIAAVDQLRTYAEILRLPLEVAGTAAEAAAAVERLCSGPRPCDTVLIDTAGRSPRDAVRLRELAEILDAVRPDEVLTVLSATSAPDVLRLGAQAFGAAGACPRRGLVFTKLDEAGDMRPLVRLSVDMQVAVRFLTHGQEVPRDLEPATRERLAELVPGAPMPNRVPPFAAVPASGPSTAVPGPSGGAAQAAVPGPFANGAEHASPPSEAQATVPGPSADDAGSAPGSGRASIGVDDQDAPAAPSSSALEDA